MYYWHFECIYDRHFWHQLLLLKYAKLVSEKYSEQQSLTRKSMKIDLWNCFGIEHESLWGKTNLQFEISWQVILVFAHTLNKDDCCKKKNKKKRKITCSKIDYHHYRRRCHCHHRHPPHHHLIIIYTDFIWRYSSKGSWYFSSHTFSYSCYHFVLFRFI